ncbi:hypothetical protein HAX54_034161 [Datura stramonium]|uniref:Uncharacterized protein n=1 Tax=Datura stramonium TaxID=4076 RepID=A0ABS8VGQ8_DATST|nr:hypothetical protein [Datura stramonium]
MDKFGWWRLEKGRKERRGRSGCFPANNGLAENNGVQRRLVVHGEEEEEGEAAVMVAGRREGNYGGWDLFTGESEDDEGKRVCDWFFGGYLPKTMEGEEDEAELVV